MKRAGKRECHSVDSWRSQSTTEGDFCAKLTVTQLPRQQLERFEQNGSIKFNPKQSHGFYLAVRTARTELIFLNKDLLYLFWKCIDNGPSVHLGSED